MAKKIKKQTSKSIAQDTSSDDIQHQIATLQQERDTLAQRQKQIPREIAAVFEDDKGREKLEDEYVGNDKRLRMAIP